MTPTEKKLSRARIELAGLDCAIACDRADGFSVVVMLEDRATLAAEVATLEAKVSKARKVNARARAFGSSMRAGGFRRTADGWQ